MKTLMLFYNSDMGSKFFEFDGDLSRLNGVYINEVGVDFELEKELFNLVFVDDTGKFKVPVLESPTKDWDIFIRCGFLS